MTAIEELTCPYIDKQKAALYGTNYYCDFDNMEFDSMVAHCEQCEMYEYLMKRAGAIILGAEYDG